VRALTSHTSFLAVAASDCSYKNASSFPTTWHSVCTRGVDNAAASQQSLDGSQPRSTMFADRDIVSLRSPGCHGVQGTA